MWLFINTQASKFTSLDNLCRSRKEKWYKKRKRDQEEWLRQVLGFLFRMWSPAERVLDGAKSDPVLNILRTIRARRNYCIKCGALSQDRSRPTDSRLMDGQCITAAASGSSVEVYIYIERGKNVLSQSQKRVPIVTTIYGAARKERDRSSLMNAYWIDVTSAGTQSWQSCRLETWWISFFFFFFKIWFDNDHVAGSGRSAHEPCWTYITYLS